MILKVATTKETKEEKKTNSRTAFDQLAQLEAKKRKLSQQAGFM